MSNHATTDIQGFGLGLRSQHYEELLAAPGAVDWLELLSENFMVEGGKPLHYLDLICAQYPVVLHGVSLSIGSCDPLDIEYLGALKSLVQRTGAHWVSDHLCWTGVDGRNLHDLMPLPYTEEAVAHVSARVAEVQDRIGTPLLLENVSSYVASRADRLSEWTFLAEVAARSDCQILLDINNVYVSAHNHGFDAMDYLAGIPADRVRQFHLAGHSVQGKLLIDTHDQPVCDDVWALYRAAVCRFGQVPTMIERDDNIPPLAELLTELDQARVIAADTQRGVR